MNFPQLAPPVVPVIGAAVPTETAAAGAFADLAALIGDGDGDPTESDMAPVTIALPANAVAPAGPLLLSFPDAATETPEAPPPTTPTVTVEAALPCPEKTPCATAPTGPMPVLPAEPAPTAAEAPLAALPPADQTASLFPTQAIAPAASAIALPKAAERQAVAAGLSFLPAAEPAITTSGRKPQEPDGKGATIPTPAEPALPGLTVAPIAPSSGFVPPVTAGARPVGATDRNPAQTAPVVQNTAAESAEWETAVAPAPVPAVPVPMPAAPVADGLTAPTAAAVTPVTVARADTAPAGATALPALGMTSVPLPASPVPLPVSPAPPAPARPRTAAALAESAATALAATARVPDPPAAMVVRRKVPAAPSGAEWRIRNTAAAPVNALTKTPLQPAPIAPPAALPNPASDAATRSADRAATHRPDAPPDAPTVSLEHIGAPAPTASDGEGAGRQDARTTVPAGGPPKGPVVSADHAGTPLPHDAGREPRLADRPPAPDRVAGVVSDAPSEQATVPAVAPGTTEGRPADPAMPPVATADAGIAGNAAPAPTVAPSVPAVRAADPAPVLAQVAGAALAAKDGVTELRLSPEELGSLRIDLRTEGDRVIISLSAERQDTLDLMRRHADRLTEDLRTLGFTRLDLSFGRWSGQGGQGAQDNAPHRTAPAAREPVTADDHHPTAAPAGPVGGLYLRI